MSNNDINSPAEYVARLESTSKQLRVELIKARAELDDAALAVATLVHQRKQLLDEYADFRRQVEEKMRELNAKTRLIDIAIENNVV